MIISLNRIVCDKTLLNLYKDNSALFLSSNNIQDYYNVALPYLKQSIENNDNETELLEMYHLVMLIARSCFIGNLSSEEIVKILYDTIKYINVKISSDDNIDMLYCKYLIELNLLGISNSKIDNKDKIDILFNILNLSLSQECLEQYFINFIFSVSDNCAASKQVLNFIINYYNNFKELFNNFQDWQINSLNTKEIIINNRKFYCFLVVYYLYALTEKDSNSINKIYDILLKVNLIQEDIANALIVFSNYFNEEQIELFNINNFLLEKFISKDLIISLFKLYSILMNKQLISEKQLSDIFNIVKNNNIENVYKEPLYLCLIPYVANHPTKENINYCVSIIEKIEEPVG